MRLIDRGNITVNSTSTMSTMINGQLILEEEYDENYQPTEQGELKSKLTRRVLFSKELLSI